MPRQTGQAGHVLGVAAHGQRVRVVEAERNADAQADLRERGAHLGQRRRLVVLEDLEVDGAQVFGVDVDAAALQRGEHDGGIAQALAVLGLAVRRGGLRQHFAEDVRLGEALRADPQHAVVGGGASARAGRDHENRQPAKGRVKSGAHALSRYRQSRQLTIGARNTPALTTPRQGLKPIAYARSAGRAMSHSAKSARLPTSMVPMSAWRPSARAA
jgi:hypothetical protein